MRIVVILMVIGVILALRYHLLSEKDKSVKKARRILQNRYLDSVENNDSRLIQAAGTDLANSELANSQDLEMLYLDALRFVRDDPTAKLYAMRIGRIKYGSANPDGKPTLVDEQAIQNDIAAAGS